MNLSLTPTIYCGRIKLQKMLHLLAAAFYEEKVKESWVNPSEIEPVNVPFYRSIFE